MGLHLRALSRLLNGAERSGAPRLFPPLYSWVVLQFYQGFAFDFGCWFCILADLSAPINLQAFLQGLLKTSPCCRLMGVAMSLSTRASAFTAVDGYSADVAHR